MKIEQDAESPTDYVNEIESIVCRDHSIVNALLCDYCARDAANEVANVRVVI